MQNEKKKNEKNEKKTNRMMRPVSLRSLHCQVNVAYNSH